MVHDVYVYSWFGTIGNSSVFVLYSIVAISFSFIGLWLIGLLLA